MIVIKSMSELPEECEKCPCYATYDGHCQADEILRASIYRPFWCPLEDNKRNSENSNLFATISRCPPYDILNIFTSKEDAIKDLIASTLCSEEEAEKKLICLKESSHIYMFAGKIECLSGTIHNSN